MYRGLRDAQSKLQLIRTLEYTQEKFERNGGQLKAKTNVNRLGTKLIITISVISKRLNKYV